MNRWHVGETRQLVERLFGREQLDLARPSLRSVDDRHVYARIHFQDAKTLAQDYVTVSLADRSLIEVALGDDDEAWGEFNFVIRRVGAHLTACVQSMHAIPDLLAHAIYYSLGMNLSSSPVRPRDISAKSMSTLMEDEPELCALARMLVEVRTGGSAKHLAAIANRAKHRSIVFPSLNEDWTGERPERHAIVFESFEYEGVRYPQVLATEFLGTEYSRVSALVIGAGNELNEVLRRRAA